MNNWSLPPHVSDPSVQKKLIDNQAKSDSLKTEAGLMGYVVGTKYAATNIASIICIASLIILIGSIFIVADTSRALQASTSLITLCLGYLFGKRNNE